MFCYACGYQITITEARFCPHCGASITTIPADKPHDEGFSYRRILAEMEGVSSSEPAPLPAHGQDQRGFSYSVYFAHSGSRSVDDVAQDLYSIPFTYNGTEVTLAVAYSFEELSEGIKSPTGMSLANGFSTEAEARRALYALGRSGALLALFRDDASNPELLDTFCRYGYRILFTSLGSATKESFKSFILGPFLDLARSWRDNDPLDHWESLADNLAEQLSQGETALFDESIRTLDKLEAYVTCLRASGASLYVIRDVSYVDDTGSITAESDPYYFIEADEPQATRATLILSHVDEEYQQALATRLMEVMNYEEMGISFDGVLDAMRESPDYLKLCAPQHSLYDALEIYQNLCDIPAQFVIAFQSEEE